MVGYSYVYFGSKVSFRGSLDEDERGCLMRLIQNGVKHIDVTYIMRLVHNGVTLIVVMYNCFLKRLRRRKETEKALCLYMWMQKARELDNTCKTTIYKDSPNMKGFQISQIQRFTIFYSHDFSFVALVISISIFVLILQKLKTMHLSYKYQKIQTLLFVGSKLG